MKVMNRQVAWLALAVVYACLAACGGGSSPGGGGAPTPTGLIPAAPAVGGVLHADTSAFRPLTANARSIYRDQAAPAGTEVTVEQTAGAGGAIVETRSDDPGTSVTVRVGTGGRIENSVRLALSPTVSIQIDGVELPAPLRQNEQFTLVDQRLASYGVDVDGDGREDAIDVAVWRRVVGDEAVNLPNRSAPMDALRVDTWMGVRLLPSGGGAARTSSGRVATWYARHIGVIREATFADGEALPFTTDELLIGRDAITSGYGYVTRPPQRPPGGSPASDPVRGAIDALPLADGAIVSTSYLSNPSLARLDKRGIVQSVHPIAQAGFLLSLRSLLRLDVGIRGLAGSFPTLSMIEIADTGQVIGAAPLARVELGNGRPNTLSEELSGIVHYPGRDRFWIVWQRTFMPAPGSTATEVVVREVRSDGSMPSKEVRIAVDAPLARNITPVALPDGVAITWVSPDMVAGGVFNRYVVVGGTLGIEIDKRFVINDSARTGSVPFSLLRDDGSQWLAWAGPTLADPAASVAHAWRVDGAGAVLGAGENLHAALAAVASPMPTAFSDRWPYRVTAAASQWFAVGAGLGPLYAGHGYPRRHVLFGQFDPGAASVTGTLQTRSQLIIPIEPANALPPLVFDDRILLLADDGFALRPTVIWR